MSPIRDRRRLIKAGNPPSTLVGVSDQLSPSQQDELRRAEQARVFIVYVALSELTLPNRHARRHSKKQIQQIAAAITEFGFINPVVIDKDGRVVCGIARVLAAQLLGIKEIPTIRVEYLTEAQKRAYAIADNRLAELASWDEATLAALFKEIDELEAGFNLEITGFDTSEIDRLVEALDKGPSSPEDEVPDPPSEEDAVTQPGDQFALDPHRLICGDARDRSVLQKLLGNELAQMVFTDPPWNLRSSAVGGLGRVQHRDFAMAAGEMSEADFTAFLIAVLGNMAELSVDGAIHYVCMDWRHAFELLTAGRKVFAELKNCCVWAKDNAGMGSFYRSQHELVFAFKNGTAPHINNFLLGQTGRYRSNIWSYAGLNTFRAGRMDELAMHPTVKPVPLVADAIRDCSKRGGIILDAFGGSGTTLIAAEKTHRRARLVELDRLYCDVIVRRWQKLTGKAARHVETGLTFAELARERRESTEGAISGSKEACHV